MEIKHKDVFKYFWKIIDLGGSTVYVKYNAYTPEKKYFFTPAESDSVNGVQLSFFQDKEYFLIPPE